jgi:hypothetical protein
MGDSQFDDLTKLLAASPGRRTTLKALAATVGGAVLSLFGTQENSIQAAARCKRVGQRCRADSECCSLFCDPATARCVCPPGANLCERTRLCVHCDPSRVFNPATCQCECPPGTTACGSVCCPAGQCCDSSGYSFCCPDGQQCSTCPSGFKICCPTGMHCVQSPYGGVFCSF